MTTSTKTNRPSRVVIGTKANVDAKTEKGSTAINSSKAAAAATREYSVISDQIKALQVSLKEIEKGLKTYVEENGTVQTYRMVEGKRMPLEASIITVTSANNHVDMDLLAAVPEVGIKGCLAIASVTQTVVKSKYGEAVLNKALITGTKEAKKFTVQQVG